MSHADLDCRAIRDSASDYLDGYAAAEDMRVVEGHLRQCLTCLGFVDDLRSTLRLLSELQEPDATDCAEIRALDCYLDYYPEPRDIDGVADLTDVKQLWARLSSLPASERTLAVREDPDYVSRPLFEWILGRARRVCNRNPENGVPLGRLALEIGRERQRRFGDSKCLALGLSGLAWCYVSLRDYRAARQLLHEAAPLGGAPGDTSSERASYLVARGFYCAETGKAEESQRLLEEALRLEIRL